MASINYEKPIKLSDNCYIRFGTSGSNSNLMINIGKGEDLRYSDNMFIVDQPTWNCQLTSVANGIVLTTHKFGKAGKERNNNVDKFLELLVERINTRCLLFDIREYGVEDLLEIIERNEYTIIFNTPYTNTTDSRMNMVYVQVKPSYDDDDEDDDY